MFLLQVSVQQVMTRARKMNCLHYEAKPPKRGSRPLDCWKCCGSQRTNEPLAAHTLPLHAQGALRKQHSQMETCLLQKATGAAERGSFSRWLGRSTISPLCRLSTTEQSPHCLTPASCSYALDWAVNTARPAFTGKGRAGRMQFSNRPNHHRKALI